MMCTVQTSQDSFYNHRWNGLIISMPERMKAVIKIKEVQYVIE